MCSQLVITIQKLDPRARIPKYQSAGASGFDFHALESSTIPAGGVGVVRTGLAMEIAQGFELQIRPRSGLAVKSHISVLNTPGTIDSDYRGEIMVILINHGKSEFAIQAGDRIAQGVVQQVFQVEFREGELGASERGAKGFGSSGVRES